MQPWITNIVLKCSPCPQPVISRIVKSRGKLVVFPH